MSKSQDRLNALAEEVTSRLIEQLEKGTAPWQKPWNGVISRPHNPLTATQYSGANWLFLQMAAEVQGFSDPRWMTFKQITDAGGHVKKGSRGVPCLYWADKWCWGTPKLTQFGTPETDPPTVRISCFLRTLGAAGRPLSSALILRHGFPHQSLKKT